MRISTSMMFDAGRNAMMRQSTSLLHTQQQIATGRRILTPADDPIAAARALEVTQSQRANEQFQTNIGYADDALKSLDSDLGAIGDILTYIRTRAVEAGNGTYSPKEHEAIAADIEAQFNSLLGIANSKDATGEYRFAGYKSDQQPFELGAGTPAPVSYLGDRGSRSIQVAPSRIMEVGESGAEIFGVDDTTRQSKVFDEIRSFIDGLKDPATHGGISQVVSTAIAEMDDALQNVLTIRASVGSRMVELESLEGVSAAHGEQYAATLSRLQDLDYAEAISRLTQQQAVLQAAQQSYVSVTGLSLFRLLG